MSRFLFMLLVLFSIGIVACETDDGDDDSNNNGDITANAGEDFEVIVGDTPTFDACNSTGAINNYAWTILSAPEPVADDAGKVIRETESNCRFTLEDAMVIEEVGEWVIQLEASNSDNTETDTVTITVVEPEVESEPADDTDTSDTDNEDENTNE